MATFDKAGKAANDFIEKAIDITEEIAVKAVDTMDVLQEVTMDMAQGAKEKMTETGEFVKKKAAEATAAVARTTYMAGMKAGDIAQSIADKMEEFAQKSNKKD
jgi:hypothetical protein